MGKIFIRHTVLLPAPLAALHASDEFVPPVKPSILWNIMDGVGTELACYRVKKIQAPNIDRIVREGTRFDRAFLTSSVCSPSRSATRPAEELYDVQADPFEIRNLAGDPQFRTTFDTLCTQPDRWMVETHDRSPESEKT